MAQPRRDAVHQRAGRRDARAVHRAAGVPRAGPDVHGLPRGVPRADRPAARARPSSTSAAAPASCRARSPRATEFAGTVTGVDQSPEFIAAAERLAAADGVGDRVEFVVGDAHDARPPGRELRRRRGPHADQPRPRPARGARRGRARGPPGRTRGDLRRGLRVADLRERRPGPRPGDGARAPVDDHELAPRHARAAAPAPAGRARPGRHAGPRVRRGRIEQLPAQPGRDLRAGGGLDRGRAARAGRRVARRPAPLRRGRHVLRGVQLLRLRGAAAAADAAPRAARAPPLRDLRALGRCWRRSTCTAAIASGSPIPTASAASCRP